MRVRGRTPVSDGLLRLERLLANLSVVLRGVTEECEEVSSGLSLSLCLCLAELSIFLQSPEC